MGCCPFARGTLLVAAAIMWGLNQRMIPTVLNELQRQVPSEPVSLFPRTNKHARSLGVLVLVLSLLGHGPLLAWAARSSRTIDFRPDIHRRFPSRTRTLCTRCLGIVIRGCLLGQVILVRGHARG